MSNIKQNFLRRDFLKGLAAVPFLGYFSFAFKNNITAELSKQTPDYSQMLGINLLKAPEEKLIPTDHDPSKKIRIGLIGNGWRGDQLLNSLGYMHPDFTRKSENGQYSNTVRKFLELEPLNVELTGICDTFSIHAQRGMETSGNDIRPGGMHGKTKPARIFPTYREMIESPDIDAVIIATPDHTHAPIAIAAAKAGKHVYLEKPMTHSIEEAVELRNVIKSTGVVFQLGHENRQQMSFKMAREIYQNGLLGAVSMVEGHTNRNSPDGAWIRKRKFDHLGTPENINWEEFLGSAPIHEFDLQRYFNWQRYSEYGTSIVGNDFSHQYDCLNQVLKLGIPETVVTTGGQYFYHHNGDIPDVMNAIFNYPARKLAVAYSGTLKSGVYRQLRIMGSEASMDIDRSIMLYKDNNSERYKDIRTDSSDPLYYYQPSTGVDAVTSATARAYIKGGYGPTFIDGKVIDATYLHLKEWLEAIRGQGRTSCDIDAGFEEAVTVNLSNLAYKHGKTIRWDSENEKAIIG